MKERVSMQEYIDVFNKIILDLEGVENIKIGDEDKVFFLLSSLLPCCMVKQLLLYMM